MSLSVRIPRAGCTQRRDDSRNSLELIFNTTGMRQVSAFLERSTPADVKNDGVREKRVSAYAS